MTKIRLGVNIDHVATVRNARGENYPSPLRAAIEAQKHGADSITIHLREDRRHIKDIDLKKLSKTKIPINLEIACNYKMMEIALKNNPNFVCIVPEKRQEITTEGGLNLKYKKNKLKKIINKLKKSKLRVSLFIEPSIQDIRIAKSLNADCVEIHTGKLANLVKSKKNFLKEYSRIKRCSEFANQLGIEVHAGHGLDYKTTKILRKIKEIEEFNIGHFIIGESIFEGLDKVIKNFKKILKL